MFGITTICQSGGLMTAPAGPSTASADFGGLGSALAGDVGPGSGRRRGRWPRRCAGIGRSRRRFVGRAPVGAAQLGRRSRCRNSGGEHARHAGVSELGRRRTRGDVDRVSEQHCRHARGRQRRSRRRLQLRSSRPRRQAHGHAGDSQAKTHLGMQAVNGGRGWHGYIANKVLTNISIRSRKSINHRASIWGVKVHGTRASGGQ